MESGDRESGDLRRRKREERGRERQRERERETRGIKIVKGFFLK